MAKRGTGRGRRLRSTLWLAGCVLGTASAGVARAADSGDPFAWLEDIRGAKSMAWVAEQNTRTAARLESDPRFETFRREAFAIFTAQDRIPMPAFRAGSLDNLWQDAAHPHGLWRTTSVESYRAAAPEWSPLIDLDALSSAEAKSWFLKGAECLQPRETDCLVALSNGGGDAVEVREFDVAERAFVPGGFDLPIGKQYAQWLTPDTIVVGRDWSGTGADLTASGYPFVLKVVQRGASAGAGREVFRGKPTDVWAQPHVLRDPDGTVRALIVERGLTFFETEFDLLGEGAPVPLPLPRKSTLQAYVDGQVVFTIQEDWRGFKAGALLAYDLAALKADPATAQPALILAPGPTEAIDDVQSTRGTLVVSMLETVKGAVDVWTHGSGGWTRRRLPLPKDAALTVRSTSTLDDRLFVSSEGFLDPTALWQADAAALTDETVRQLPARFDASSDVSEQRFATSADGTRVPYFLVRPKTMKADGSTPVQMFGYGGFQLSETPAYRPEMGKLWLERGGAYVVANIRGGGEFGPGWHEAALLDERQRAFDDFAAVARDLIATHVTSPARLGIYGRSNGGVLMSVSMTQHPELFGAVVIESPLIDMLRYTHLSAGASWAAEYGDPDVPKERVAIAAYSAYQNLKAGVKYPEPYITTNTEDDRVHPGHARKFAARLESLGDPVLFYENTFGGHANDADPELNARRWARHYVYLTQKLMDPTPAK